MSVESVRAHFRDHGLEHEILEFGERAKMMSPGEVLEKTGHPVGGVCPFALKEELEIYLDESLRPFEKIYPAAGSKNSCIEITPEELFRITGAQWIDVCK
jgi:prolyl-tRNA editing enzyme YbaK/EbsC (Cys-tRNA(Pro) deacylase)